MSGYRIVRYRGSFAICWTDAARGRLRRSLGTTDRGIAEARARQIWQARNAPASDKLKDLWPAYVADRLKTVARKDRFAGTWAALAPHFADKVGRAINADDCRLYAASRRQQNRRPSTIRTEIELLRACLRFHYGANAPRLWLPPASPPRDIWLTRDQVAALLAATPAPHVRLFIVLAIATGARMSAITDLTWERVHLDTDPAVVNLLPAGRHQTNKRRPIVPLNRGAVTALRAARLIAETDHVIEYDGRPVQSVKGAIRRLAARTGIPVTPHVFRHTAGVWMAQANVPMQKIAQYLGHTSTRVTEHTYARYSPNYMQDAAAALEIGSIEPAPPNSPFAKAL